MDGVGGGGAMKHVARIVPVIAALLLSLACWDAAGAALAPCSPAQSASKSLGEKSIASLPAGPLSFRLESFPTLAAAQAVAGPLGVAAEASGKAWLLTL